MVTDEKGVVGSENTFIENGKGSFELRRAARVADERTLLRIRDERTFAILKRKRDGVLGAGVETREARQADETGGLKKTAAIHARKLIGRNRKEKAEGWHARASKNQRETLSDGVTDENAHGNVAIKP